MLSPLQILLRMRSCFRQLYEKVTFRPLAKKAAFKKADFAAKFFANDQGIGL